MRLTMEGSTIEKLVKEVHQATVQSTTDLEVLKLEFIHLYNKVEKPVV